MFKRIWESLKKKSTWRWILFLLVLFIPVLVYMIRFRNYTISDNPSDWADFGSYVGGIYTVLVTFLAILLTRHLEHRDAERNKAKNAASTIFEQMSKIDYRKVDLKSVGRYLRLVNQNEIYIPEDLYDRLVSFHDDYVEAKDNPDSFDIQKEAQLKKRLRNLYDA